VLVFVHEYITHLCHVLIHHITKQHPPAGAASIVFSSMKNQWANMGIFLCGVSITIINAVLINNMSDKRQYPTSWPYLSRAKAKVGICKDE